MLDKYGFGGILADDMGLGKTIQILSVLVTTKNKEKTKQASLVVAPSSLTLNWKNEAEKFAKDLDILIINGQSDERIKKINDIKNYDLVITSYDLLKRDIEEYEKLDFSCYNKFRKSTDLGHYLCRYWQMVSGNFVPKKMKVNI